MKINPNEKQHNLVYVLILLHCMVTSFQYYYRFCLWWGSCCSIISFFCKRCLSLHICSSFSNCIVCSSSIYGYLFPFWYLQPFLEIFPNLQFFVECFVDTCSCLSFVPFLLFWPLCCLSFFDLRVLIASLVSSNFSWNISESSVSCVVFCKSLSNQFGPSICSVRNTPTL